MKNFRIQFFVWLTVIGFTACSPTKPDERNSIITALAKARLDSTLKSLVDSGRVAGIAALIVEKDKEAYFNAFGYADRENNIAMDRNTIVRIYSMTKPITGVALMKLYEQGAFQLDDPLAKYAPEFANVQVLAGTDANGNMILETPHRPITIRDITRHTAGFVTNTPDTTTRFGKLVKETDPMNPDNTLTQMAQKLGSLPLTFHPGAQWAYGPCVDVQAFLVERLSGKSFDQYVMENILDPLKMNTTRYFVPEDQRNRFAAMYSRGDDGKLNRIPDDIANEFNTKHWPLKPGGWGLTSTVDDYMRFARMLVNEGTFDQATILKPSTVELMATNHLADSVTERMWLPSKGQVGFGIDFAVRLHPPASVEEKNGVVGEFFWDGAASTLFWVDPVNQLTAVLFVQIFPFDNLVHKKFRDAVYGPVSTRK
ncbi:MAG: beta-lactamase family protein [Cyclobacteriaceae bacterium]|nr:beta-lactamase family protein [Cyclobacteriaceae bacterium]